MSPVDRVGRVPVKPIDPSKLFTTPGGLVAVKSEPDAEGKSTYMVLRSPQWAVRSLFGKPVDAFFIGDDGLNLETGNYEAELEFPGYFGKFVLKSQANVVLFADAAPDARWIVAHSYKGKTWGVSKESLAKLFPEGSTEVPDLDAEFKQLEAPFPVEGEGGLWAFHGVDREANAFEYGKWRFTRVTEGTASKNTWAVEENGVYVGDVNIDAYPFMARPRPEFMSAIISAEVDGHFDPRPAEARFNALHSGKPTVVPLSSGSGFTKEEASSHAVVDEKGDVTIVDPNVNVIEDLSSQGIPLSSVKRIVVSHAHFDHIAGLWRLLRHLPQKPELFVHSNAGDLQKIAEGLTDEGEMSTLTTLVAMAEKATHGRVKGAELIKAMKVVPLQFGKPMMLGSLPFEFFFGNHTIPAVGYRIVNSETGLPAFLFTGDTRLDAESLFGAKSKETGAPVMSSGRADFLSHMVERTLFAGGKVLADGGVAGIHPAANYYLAMLSSLRASGIRDVRLSELTANLYLYHEGEQNVLKSGLQYAGSGWKNAIDISKQVGWSEPRYDDVIARMSRRAALGVSVLANLSAADLEEFLQMGTAVTYKKVNGSTATHYMMRDGETADSFYLLLDGAVKVTKDTPQGRITLANVTSGLVGEAVFAGHKMRNADVEIESPVTALKFGGDAVEFLKDKGIAAAIVRLREMRVFAQSGTYPALTALSSDTRDEIFLAADVVKVNAGDVIMREGERSRGLYVVVEGELAVTKKEGPLASRPIIVTSQDGVIGEGTLSGGKVRSATVFAKTDAQLMYLDGERAMRLQQSSPEFNAYLLGLVQTRQSAVAIAPVPEQMQLPLGSGGVGGPVCSVFLAGTEPTAMMMPAMMAVPMMGGKIF